MQGRRRAPPQEWRALGYHRNQGTERSYCLRLGAERDATPDDPAGLRRRPHGSRRVDRPQGAPLGGLLRRRPPPRPVPAVRHAAGRQHRDRLHGGCGGPRLPGRAQRLVVGRLGGARITGAGVLGRAGGAAHRGAPRPADGRRLPRAPLRPAGARHHRRAVLDRHPVDPRGTDRRDVPRARRRHRARLPRGLLRRRCRRHGLLRRRGPAHGGLDQRGAARRPARGLRPRVAVRPRGGGRLERDRGGDRLRARLLELLGGRRLGVVLRGDARAGLRRLPRPATEDLRRARRCSRSDWASA